ncbi:MAG: Gfo/Idh/MocA family oxidoreductase [Gemmatimonadales bacterium]
MGDVVRVGVIGTGAIAQVAHLVVLSKMDGVEICALCDTDVAKAQALGTRFGASAVYDDIVDLLRQAKPDAVVVCTPNHLHEVHTVTALSEGVPVLCERPLALTSAGVQRVMNAQESSGAQVMVGMNHRYRGDIEVVKAFLAGGELGALRSVRAYWHIFRPTGIAAGWRERPAESGGGAMFDLGLPLVDLALWLAQCPATKRISAMFSGREGSEGVEDFASAHMQCHAGHSLFVDVSWRHVGPHEKFAFEIVGDCGSAAIAPLKVYKEMHGTPVDVTPSASEAQADPFSASYQREWQHFLGALRGERPAPELVEQLLLHRTMEAIQRSAHEGRETTL